MTKPEISYRYQWHIYGKDYLRHWWYIKRVRHDGEITMSPRPGGRGSTQVWKQGHAFTKRGARRKMRRVVERDKVNRQRDASRDTAYEASHTSGEMQ